MRIVDDTASMPAVVYGEFSRQSLVEAPKHSGKLGVPYPDASVIGNWLVLRMQWPLSADPRAPDWSLELKADLECYARFGGVPE